MKARTATGRGQVAKFTLIQKGDLQGRSRLPGVGAERAVSANASVFEFGNWVDDGVTY